MVLIEPGAAHSRNASMDKSVAMLHPSKRLLFAIEAVLDIAYYGGSQPVQSGEISGRQGIPRRYLEQVLQHLVRAGILAGHRGPKGGYMLAKDRRRISLGEIVRAVRDALPREIAVSAKLFQPATPRRLRRSEEESAGHETIVVGSTPTGFSLAHSNGEKPYSEIRGGSSYASRAS